MKQNRILQNAYVEMTYRDCIGDENTIAAYIQYDPTYTTHTDLFNTCTAHWIETLKNNPDWQLLDMSVSMNVPLITIQYK